MTNTAKNGSVRYEPETETSRWYDKSKIIQRKDNEVIIDIDTLEFRGVVLAENNTEIEVDLISWNGFN